MPRILLPLPFASLTLLAAGLLAQAAPPDETHKVTDTYNKSPFSYRTKLDQEFDSFRVYQLTYPSPVATALKQNNTITAEFYLPRGMNERSKPRPAVICIHILGGGYELTQLQCSALARRGIPAIWFKLPYYGERGPPEGVRVLAGNPRLFTQAVHQGIEDIRRTVDVLASRPEIDPKHIGVMGVSLGGIVAGTAAGEESRISRAVLILAGGDLLPIVHTARETQQLSATLRRLPAEERAEVEKAIVSADPLQHAAALRELARQGRVLMINAAEDEVIPRASTEKLAAALGIKDKIIWLDGLGHYTALAALPQALKAAVDFFAEDLPADVAPPPPIASTAPRSDLARIWRQLGQFLNDEPKPGHCHLADLETHLALRDGRTFVGRVRIVRGPKTEFAANVKIPGIADDVSIGNGGSPWLAVKGKAFVGDGDLGAAGVSPARATARTAASQPPAVIGTLSPECQKGLVMVKGVVSMLAMAPEFLDQWATINAAPSTIRGERVICILRTIGAGDVLRVCLHADGSPARLEFQFQGTRANVIIHAWQIDTPAQFALFEPPHGLKVQEVPSADLAAMYAAGLNLAADRIRPPAIPPVGNADKTPKIVARDPAGHGLLCEFHGKTVLFVEGTPEQMGRAHGWLLRNWILRLAERVVYAAGAADTLRSGTWWFDRMAEIQRRAGPHVPQRFFAECDAMARAAGVSIRDARAANLFPERFHCSGVALRGKATSDGRVLHARVLDYMTEIGLQNYACVTVVMPEKRNAWISAGYAGFLGTVTAMNERGLAIGEMGGRGEGQWDGVPMSFLLRDVMERAATVQEALAILRQSPRTCEYYYVISDKSRDMVGVYCTPKEVTVLRPGKQNPQLPKIPEDVVLISGGHRAELLSERIQQSYGRIDAAGLAQIIKRPVAMNSNLHDAIFSPETLEFWIADAGNTTQACDEPYAKFNLKELLQYFRRQ